jgi:hypothetical protein
MDEDEGRPLAGRLGVDPARAVHCS